MSPLQIVKNSRATQPTFILNTLPMITLATITRKTISVTPTYLKSFSFQNAMMEMKTRLTGVRIRLTVPR